MTNVTGNRGAVKVATVHVTTDAKKLWSCANFSMLQPQHMGKLPLNAGEPIRVHLPPERRPDSWNCESKFVWRVVNEDSEKIFGQRDKKMCEHQIDID